jgi:hypothetical protein
VRSRGAPIDALARESTEASTVVARSENGCARGSGGDAMRARVERSMARVEFSKGSLSLEH